MYTNFYVKYTILAELRRDVIIHMRSANDKSSKCLGIESSVFNAIYIKYCRKYRYRRASCLRVTGLNILTNRFVGYIHLGGFHAPLVGGLKNFVNRNVGYIDLGGLHSPVI